MCRGIAQSGKAESAAASRWPILATGIAALLSMWAPPAVAMNFAVADGDADRTITSAEVSDLVASGEDLVKTGGGRLVIDKPLKGYRGAIQVREGYLLAAHNEAFGETDKGTTVSSGATLEFGNGTAAFLFGSETFTVSGTGVDGRGALRYVGSANQARPVFQNIVLAGNARFGGPASYRWDLRGSGRQGTLDMGGHSLEITGNFGLLQMTVSNPGSISVTGSGAFLSLEGPSVLLGGSSANTLTVGSGATLGLQKFGPALEWGVVLDGGKCQAVTESGDFMARNRLNGPITINAGASFTGAGAKEKRFVTLAGDITLNASSVGTGNNGVDLVVFQGNDDDGAQLAAYRALQSAADSRIRLLFCAANGVDSTPVASAGDIGAGVFRINSTTNSSVALTGSQSGTTLVSSNGIVAITGSNKAHLFNTVTIAGTYPSVARLSVTNAAFGSSPTTVYAGRDGRTRGILEILDGAAATNILNAGHIENIENTNDVCHGSVFVRGGELVLPASTKSYPGYRGSGYVEISGGSLVVRGEIFPGTRPNAVGVWRQKGGNVQIQNNGIVFGQYSRAYAPSRGLYRQSGGTNDCWGPFVLGKTLWDESNAASKDIVTISGGVLGIDNGIDLAGEPDSRTIFNLNGGRVTALFMQVITNQCQTCLNGSGANPASKAIDGNFAWVNFNGGTFRYRRNANKSPVSGRTAYKADSFFYGDPERMRITSYGAGAIFDTAGYNAKLDHSITAPEGQGLASVALPSGLSLPDWAFAGEPAIEISGDGHGASAAAEFDSISGRVTGVTVTSPGYGYTDISAKMSRGGWTNAIDLVSTLGAPVAGGLTKRGAGTLTATAANTYGGATRIEGGTLSFTRADGMPGGDVEFAAEALMAANSTAPLLRAVRYTGGRIRVTEAETLDGDSWRGTKTVATFTEPLAVLPDIAFVKADGTVASPGAWKFALADGGAAIALSYIRAMMVIVR